MADFTIYFDGGSLGNGTPDQWGYGSFTIYDNNWAHIKAAQLRIKCTQFFGNKTNNESEYMALMAALDSLQHSLRNEGTDLEYTVIDIFGDSALVINQIKGVWKAKDTRMINLMNHVRRQLFPYKGWSLSKVPRDEIVRELGH